MPIAIIVFEDGTIPAILQAGNEQDLFADMRGLSAVPPLADVAAARVWLAGLKDPSGWYESPDEARAAVARMRLKEERLSGDPVAQARAALCKARGLTTLSRAKFAGELGYNGNENTRHKLIFDVENGKKNLSPEASRALRSLLLEEGIEGK